MSVEMRRKIPNPYGDKKRENMSPRIEIRKYPSYIMLDLRERVMTRNKNNTTRDSNRNGVRGIFRK